MVRDHFPHLLEGDHAWEHGMRHVVANTYEFGEFLEKVLKVGMSGLCVPEPTTATYHYTCHLRGLGIGDQPANMLKKLGNLELRPMEKTDQCCGFGGTFAVKYPAISGAIVDDKVRMHCRHGSGDDGVQ